MDLNYLLSREQISLMRADVAGCDASRDSHLGLARKYRDRIRIGFPMARNAIVAAR